MSLRTSDDRGRDVPVHMPWGIGSIVCLMRFGAVLVCSSVLVYAALVLLAPRTGLGAILPTVLGIAVIAMLVFPFLLPSRFENWARSTRVKRGRCASCRYSLIGVSAAPDGCVVCPECGAAWRVASGECEEPLAG
jgi:hypothetical protein